MWMLSFVPDSFLLYIVNLILVAGVIGTFLSFFLLHKIVRWFPAIAPYHLILQIVSIILLVGGVYLKGGYGVEMSWREKLRVAEEKARLAEEQSKEANKKLDDEIKKKTKVIKENTIVYRDRIKEVAVIMDKECKVIPEAIEIHNAAAKNQKLGESK